MQFPISYGEYLTGPVNNRVAELGDEKSAGQNQTADREKVPVPALAGTGSQLLQFDFLVTVGSELRFKIALIHC